MNRVVAIVATPALLPDAIECLARGDARARANYETLFADGTLAPSDVIVMVPEAASSPVIGAILTLQLGGGQASVWPPVAADTRVADALVRNAVRHLRSAGARILQAICPPAVENLDALERAGFKYTSELLFAERELHPREADYHPPFQMAPAAYDDLNFAVTIAQTYFDSLDMPELNDTRGHEEILAGCQQSARTMPPLWWYARSGEGTLGVIQLAPADGEVELVYMGLVPAARKRGFGVSLARTAIALAAPHGSRLTLSFDTRNVSARRVYAQLGFEEKNCRGVWLKIMPH